MFRGELCEETGEFGRLGMLERENGRFLILGEIANKNDEFQFSGYGMVVDQKDLTIYRGQLLDGQKHGVGHLMKFKTPRDLLNTATNERYGFQDPATFIKRMNINTYKNLLTKEIEHAKASARMCEKKVSKLKSQLMADANWTEHVYYTREAIELKSQKWLELSSRLQTQYKGEFISDLRSGFGVNYNSSRNNHDIYRGEYSDDQMNGRGIYLFNSDPKKHQNSLYYAGNFKQGICQGHGKMVYRDATTYHGTFVHNQMTSPNSVIEYGNGDKYEGAVEQCKKWGNGTYVYQNGDKYIGSFRNDLKHTIWVDGEEAQGEMQFYSL